MICCIRTKIWGGLSLLAVFSFISASCSPALAGNDNVRKLTDDTIKAFIQDTSHMTKPRGEFLSPDAIRAYLDTHLSEDARFVSTITYNLPNMPPQTTSISLDKAKFIETVNQGTESIEGYDNTVKITDIEINWWGNQAHVKTENIETGFMPIPTENGGTGESMPIKGHSFCAQTLALNDGVIQIGNAICKTELTFSE